MSTVVDQLPVAGPPAVRRAAWALIRRDLRLITVAVGLNALATAAGLAAPWLLGRIVDAVTRRAGAAAVDGPAAAILAIAVAQLLLVRLARGQTGRFGERTAARVRERFIDRVLGLPAAVVGRVATGDLATRGTADVTTVATALRDAGADLFVALLQTAFIVVAIVLVQPVLAVCGLLAVLGTVAVTRWYLPRARSAYTAAGAANSDTAEMLAATVAGARTVEAMGLQERRIAVSRAVIGRSRDTRLRALALRTVFLPTVDVVVVLPVVAVLVVGAALIAAHATSLGAVVAVALYFRRLTEPFDLLTLWLDQLQSAAASFARIEGVGEVPVPPTTAAEPVGRRLVVDGVHYAYGDGPDVLRGVSLDVRPGERIAVVGPSGAGKSTLGRLLCGIDAPRSGTVAVGGVAMAALTPDRRRRHVVLVTQEQHVFRDTLRQNLLIARPAATDAELREALADVGAHWAGDLLDTDSGVDGHRLDPAQAGQLALARVVLADPHTVVLDEATAAFDPRTARSVERALSAVLTGRTVIAIAHRLHTAHDADRVVMMEDGQITEVGPHAELLAHGGAYAALWRSWHGAP